MRSALVIASGLALIGCHGDVRLNEPTPFALDDCLTEDEMEVLLEQLARTDPAMLDCEDACEARYYQEHAFLHTLVTITVCELTIDGELTGVGNMVVGTLHCEGTEIVSDAQLR